MQHCIALWQINLNEFEIRHSSNKEIVLHGLSHYQCLGPIIILKIVKYAMKQSVKVEKNIKW